MGRIQMKRWTMLLVGSVLFAPVGAMAQTAAQVSGVADRSMETLKERLSDKASDEQRVNDCKVPPEKRTRVRPTDCGSAVMSATHVQH
jgi:hypothetical protein